MEPQGNFRYTPPQTPIVVPDRIPPDPAARGNWLQMDTEDESNDEGPWIREETTLPMMMWGRMSIQLLRIGRR